MNRVDQPDRPLELDDHVRQHHRLAPKGTASRSAPQIDVHARLAKVIEHLQRNSLFALTADQLDQLALQREQWEATAYAVAAEIVDRAHTEAAEILSRAKADATTPAISMASVRAAEEHSGLYSGRHHAEPAPHDTDLLEPRQPAELTLLDALRPQLWPIVRRLIERHHGDDDLEANYERLHLAFSWVEQNSDHMPRAEADISAWLDNHCHVLWDKARR